MAWSDEHTKWCREQFPALSLVGVEGPLVFLDGPAGTQVPRRVVEAMSDYLCQCNANMGGCFPTAWESDRWLAEARQGVADFLGTGDPETIAFGQNMTTLTLGLSRALSRTWQPGDEIVLTQLEHDANYTPWMLAARDAGVTVRVARINRSDCTLDLEDLQRQLTPRTKLVAVACASNATGSRTPVPQICTMAHQVGAQVFLDGVHFAPHDLTEVEAWGCDYFVCSAYKFFGPHLGILWGRREWLESLQPYKLRPAPDALPGRWMTGTQSHEAIMGTLAAIDYLADLGRFCAGRRDLDRREALSRAFHEIREYEQQLAQRLLRQLEEIPQGRIVGIREAERAAERMPTVAWIHPHMTSRELAQHLGEQAICTWHGNYYALPLTQAIGVEPAGMLRIGAVHYNTVDEIDRVVAAIRRTLV